MVLHMVLSVVIKASKVAGVAKVVVAEDAAYEHGIAENISSLIESLHKANK
jgi:O-succinylbenzoate synthase